MELGNRLIKTNIGDVYASRIAASYSNVRRKLSDEDVKKMKLKLDDIKYFRKYLTGIGIVNEKDVNHCIDFYKNGKLELEDFVRDEILNPNVPLE